MAENLYGVVGKSGYDNLIADISFPLQTGSGIVLANAGLLLRGTLMGKDAAGKLVPASATVEADCILTDDINVGVEDVTVVTYISGAFAMRHLIAENDVKAHQDTLRKKGIYLKYTVGGDQ